MQNQLTSSNQTQQASLAANELAKKAGEKDGDQPTNPADTDEVKQTEQGGVIVFGTVFEVGDNYQIVSPIGQGAYGVVVAAKRIDQNA